MLGVPPETLTTPDHDEHDRVLEWVGGAWVAEAFDLDEIRERLR